MHSGHFARDAFINLRIQSTMKQIKQIIPLSLVFFLMLSCGNISENGTDTRNKEKNRESTAIEVTADLQTEPVRDTADAADDPAIWIHPENPEKSLLIGTNKKRGLAVYDLQGREVFFAPLGRVNNVDVRYNFPLNGEKVDIVAASNRTNNTLSIMRIMGESGELQNIAANEIISGVDEVYGFCLYHNKTEGRYYAIVNSKSGMVEQWLLEAGEAGLITAALVRSFEVGGQTEGCVADDETGLLYIGEEERGIWKYFADPDKGNDRTLVDDMSNPNLEADIEGLAIYYAEGGKGYLIASSQGNNSFAVYNRTGKNEYLGSFVIAGAAGGIDGTEDTDGIDVINMAMGSAFPNGFFIAQDGYNEEAGVIISQNFKLVAWEKIAGAFTPALLIDNSYNIRD
jgi:3-phytase